MPCKLRGHVLQLPRWQCCLANNCCRDRFCMGFCPNNPSGVCYTPGIALLNYGESTCSKTAVNSQRFSAHLCLQVPVGPVLQNLFFCKKSEILLRCIIGEFWLLARISHQIASVVCWEQVRSDYLSCWAASAAASPAKSRANARWNDGEDMGKLYGCVPVCHHHCAPKCGSQMAPTLETNHHAQQWLVRVVQASIFGSRCGLACQVKFGTSWQHLKNLHKIERLSSRLRSASRQVAVACNIRSCKNQIFIKMLSPKIADETPSSQMV